MSGYRSCYLGIASILVVLVCVPWTAHATIPASERAALIDIYNSTTGGGWYSSDNWRNGGDTDFNAIGTECTWFGVTCDGAEEHVTRIGLQTNNLNGSLPLSIGDFPSLIVLEILGNPNLTGPIPGSIGNLAALQVLNAYDGSLSGPLPPEMGNLSNLYWLELSYNQIGGTLPPELGNLAALEELEIVGNQLTGSIPAEIGNLSNVKFIHLGFNQLSGTVPGEIGNLANLRTLSLEHNSLSGPIPAEIWNLRNLGRLNLQRNQIVGRVPDEIVLLAGLYDGTGLYIRYNGFYTDSLAVDAFLDSKHPGDWRATQTVAPTNVAIGTVTNTTVELTWTPIQYASDSGGYSVWFAPVSGGPYALFGTTADKSASSMTVTGLNPVQDYFFVVDTKTDPSYLNQNTVTSEPSLEVSARTFSGGGPALSIGDATVVEGDNGTTNLVFTVSLSQTVGWTVTVDVVTGDDTATAGSDYVAATVPLTFTTGDLSETASITVNGDTLVEGDESLHGTLSNVTGASVGRYIGTGTIQDDDQGLVSHERQALIDIYNSTNGGGWLSRTNWRNAGDTDFNSPGSECSWHGVTCDLTGQRVKELRLDQNNLTGFLPASVGDFTALDLLVLSGNNMVGEIPAEIGTMAALGHLDMAYAGALTGSIPPELGDLSNLDTLYLFDLELSGSIPPEIGQLSNLKILDLRVNQLSGSIPIEIGGLASLERLSLRDNQLEGEIPPQIGDLSMLVMLDLTTNQLSGSLPVDLADLPNLDQMWIRDNLLDGSIPADLSRITTLRALDLGNNQFTGAVPPVLGTLDELLVLRLDGNELTGTIPVELADLPVLSSLDLGDNNLSGQIPVVIASLSNLTDLRLNGNALTGGIPPGLGSLSSLVWLYLHDNRLSGGIPPQLGDLGNLEVLLLKSNRLAGPVPSELADLSNLRNLVGLDLRWNGLSSDDLFVTSFLNTKHSSRGDWRENQTTPPENVAAGTVTDHTVWLSWDAIDYTDELGGYEVFSSPTGSGTWTSGGWTADKNETVFPVGGLDPGMTYDFVVAAFTDPHADNLNLVVSDHSDIQMATTSNLGCTEPEIEIDLSSGITLSVSGSFGTYSWSTGETTPSIVVDPPTARWYWVTVTSAGGCEDAAAAFVAPPVFVDSFESGDTSGWSSVTP